MSDLLQTSISGLLAFQNALQTTSHNISNANTDGYSRQRVELQARTPFPTGAGYLGTGVRVTTIQRLYDATKAQSVRTNTSESARLSTYSGLTGRVDSLLGDQSAGLDPALQDFFDAAQGVANDPTSTSARQVLLARAQSLADRFHSIDGSLASLDHEVQTGLATDVSQVNDLAGSIAKLNAAIVTARGAAGGQPPNDLLDQRDALLTKLAGQISTQVVSQPDGSVNVFIGTGQSLVTGSEASSLKLTANNVDPQQPEIALVNPGGASTTITRFLSGGAIGGLLDFRRDVLLPTRDQLGTLATSIAVNVNNQQNLGFAFPGGVGQLGSDFFSFAQPQVLSDPSNPPAAQPSVSVDPATIGNLAGGDYSLSFDGTNATLTRLSDGTTTTLAGGVGVADGLSIDASALAAGDSVLVRTTAGGAAGIGVNLTRPDQIAAAVPLSAGEQTDATGQSINTGSASVSALGVGSTQNLPLGAGGKIVLTYDAAGKQFVVSGGPGGTIPYDVGANPQYLTQGKQVNFPAWGDASFTISGTPSDGDAFVIQDNTGGVGDNGNILAIGALRQAGTMSAGSASFGDAYASLVSQVGVDAMQAQTASGAQQTMLQQAQSDLASLSGVNLDEEAANLVKYQQAYQAAAQVVNVSRTLFQSLLDAVR